MNKPGNPLKIKKIRYRKTPAHWRKIAETENPLRLRNWQLVLDSQNLPFFIHRAGYSRQIYVPPFLEKIAACQIAAYNNENKTKYKGTTVYAIYPHAWLIFLPLALLALWHGIRIGDINTPWIPGHIDWLSTGALDSIKIEIFSEYWRPVTALTLHMDAAHLAGNLFFGFIFLYLLAKRTGYGKAFLLATIGGICGNYASIFFHRQNWLSIGFSTAVFAAAGSLAGIMASKAQSRKNFFIACGSALGLLAMLGTGEEKTDYAAHCCGLVSGLVLGWLAGIADNFKLPRPPDLLAFFLAFLIYFAAWILALNLP